MNEAAEVIRKFVEALTGGDLDTVLASMSPDVEVVEPESLAFGGVFHGIDAFRDKVLSAIVGKFEPAVAHYELIAQGDRVVLLMDTRLTSIRTRRTLAMAYVEIYTVRDGKICRVDVYPQDTKKLVEFWNEN